MTLKLLIVDDARCRQSRRLRRSDDLARLPGVTLAADAEEALRRFDEEATDLVVLDLAMPPPDGFEVCRRIRRFPRCRS